MEPTEEEQKNLNSVIRILGCFTELCGRTLAWLSFAMMILTVIVVLMRYLFQSGNLIMLQEGVIYLHACAFMLGAAWTLKREGHVRVDVRYRNMSERAKAWVDSLGTLLFLLPVSVFLLWVSMDFVGRAWEIREVSAEPGGIPGVFLLKSLIPLMAGLMIIQGVYELLKNAFVLMRSDES